MSVMNEVKIIDVGNPALPLLKITPKMIWEARLAKIGGCKLPRGYGRTKPFEINPFKTKLLQGN